MSQRRASLAIVLLLTGIAVAPVRSQTYTVRPDSRSHVRFTAHTTTEEFSGNTGRVEGTVTLHPATGTVKDRAEAKITVDLASLDTGNGQRDRHMRDRYLETKRYPTAVFTLQRVISPKQADFAPGRAVVARVEGTMAIHGVERPLSTDVTITRVTRETIGGRDFPVEALRLHATFSVRLEEFKIRTPRFLFIRMSQTQEIDLDLFAEGPRRSSARTDRNQKTERVVAEFPFKV